MQSIDQQTMICSFETALPRQSRQLKEEAKKIEKNVNAESGTVRAPSMTYFRRKGDKAKNEPNEVDGLQLLKDVQYAYKLAVHKLARYPYSGGFYLAPAPVIADLLKLEAEYEKGVDGKPSKIQEAWFQWCTEEYPGLKESAPTRMGTMYDEQDFPSLADCKKRFKAHLTILPLAPKDQVARITLISPEHQQLLSLHANAAQQSAITDLRKQIWKDFLTPLKKVVEVFNKEKPKVYESLLGGIMEVVNIIPSYKGLFNDDALMAAAEQVRAGFANITTEGLRSSDEQRKVAFAAASNMLNQLDPFVREFSEE